MSTESVTTNPPLHRKTGNQTIHDVDHKAMIEEVKQHGASLLFGYQLSLEEFEAFTNKFCSDWQTYQGGAHEKRILNPEGDSTIYSVNFYFGRKEQYAFPLHLHSDMSYMKNRPAIICFWVVSPSKDRGETTIIDGVDLLNALSDSTRTFFEQKKILYKRVTPPERRMQKFYTEDFAEAEAFCKLNDLTLEEDDEGNWTTRYVISAIRTSMFGNHEVFSNSMMPVLWQMERGLVGSYVMMEDESPIPPEIVAELREIQDTQVYKIKWEQPGDFGIVDNTRMMHGRMDFDDLDRDIVQRLGRTVDW